jgi:glycosyltransferase involved in cell wall biosynthesis
MKIAFINLIGKGKFGGGEKWMVTAALELAKKGHDVIIIGNAGSKFLSHAEKFSIDCACIGWWEKITGIYLFKIAWRLFAGKIDILVCNLNTDVRTAGMAAKIVKTPVILARHGLLMFGTPKHRYRFYCRYILDGIITNSNTIKETYAAYNWFDDTFVKVIHNGIDLHENIDPHEFTKRFPGKKIIYSAGRLAIQKGFGYLIDAAAILLENRDDIVFFVSGEGRLADELKARVGMLGIENQFVFGGFAPDIHPYLMGCDLFVLASLFEGMPNVVMEAMAAGKPVIATDVNGTSELLEDGISGLIVPPADPAALASAIASLIDDKKRMESFGNAGKKRVEENFTVQQMADKLEEHLLRKIAEKQCGP